MGYFLVHLMIISNKEILFQFLFNNSIGGPIFTL